MSGHKVCKERNRNYFAVIEVIEPIKIDVLNTCLNVFHRWRAVLHWLVSVKKHDCVTRIAAKTIVRYLYVETWDLIGPFNIAPYRLSIRFDWKRKGEILIREGNVKPMVHCLYRLLNICISTQSHTNEATIQRIYDQLVCKHQTKPSHKAELFASNCHRIYLIELSFCAINSVYRFR